MGKQASGRGGWTDRPLKWSGRQAEAGRRREAHKVVGSKETGEQAGE